MICWGILVVAFGFTIYGMLNLGWSYPEMSAIFLIAGILAAIVNKVGTDNTINMILDGMRGAMSGALIIGVARAVQLTMANGGLIPVMETEPFFASKRRSDRPVST